MLNYLPVRMESKDLIKCPLFLLTSSHALTNEVAAKDYSKTMINNTKQTYICITCNIALMKHVLPRLVRPGHLETNGNHKHLVCVLWHTSWSTYKAFWAKENIHSGSYGGCTCYAYAPPKSRVTKNSRHRVIDSFNTLQ